MTSQPRLTKPVVESAAERWRGLEPRKVPEQQQRPTLGRVVSRALLALCNVLVHRDHVDSRQGIVYEGNVLLLKGPTVHRVRLPERGAKVWVGYPPSRSPFQPELLNPKLPFLVFTRKLRGRCATSGEPMARRSSCHLTHFLSPAPVR